MITFSISGAVNKLMPVRKIPIIVALLFTLKNGICQRVDTVLVFKPAIENEIINLTHLDTIFNKSHLIIPRADSGKFTFISVKTLNIKNQILHEGKYKLSKVDTINAIHEYANGERKDEIRKLRFTYLRDGYWYNYKNGKMHSTYYFEGRKLRQKIK